VLCVQEAVAEFLCRFVDLDRYDFLVVFEVLREAAVVHVAGERLGVLCVLVSIRLAFGLRKPYPSLNGSVRGWILSSTVLAQL
jgi:hypothetical protein